MQRKVVGALVVALMVVVEACGGSGSTPLTTAQLRAQASAVCRDVTRQIQALAASARPSTRQASLRQAATAMTDGLARLRALTPPKALADRYASFVAWKGSQRDAARQLAEPGGRLTARAAEAVNAHRSPAFALARALGIDGCV